MEASSREASLSNAARAELYPASSLAGDRTRDGLSGDETFPNAPPTRLCPDLARSTALRHSLVSESVVFPLELPPEFSSFSLSADASIDALDASRWRLADVLTNELSATQNLRAWPCRSLWVDMDDAALVEAAKALSPNCSRPFTTCSVGRDREEMFGKRSEPIK